MITQTQWKQREVKNRHSKCLNGERNLVESEILKSSANQRNVGKIQETREECGDKLKITDNQFARLLKNFNYFIISIMCCLSYLWKLLIYETFRNFSLSCYISYLFFKLLIGVIWIYRSLISFFDHFTLFHYVLFFS